MKTPARASEPWMLEVTRRAMTATATRTKVAKAMTPSGIERKPRQTAIQLEIIMATSQPARRWSPPAVWPRAIS